MPPAARLTDLHACPMVTPGLPPIPHVGGPVIGPGEPTVLIGKLPAAVLGDN
ncbi:type VI secretion protein, partial [Dickeya dianthicola]